MKADRTQLDQVIINLAVNAKDAMPDGGRLTIAMRNVGEQDTRAYRGQGMSAGEYVEIAVSDTGHGMTPEIMTKIFEPFFSTKEVGKGTGLGLSTVYGIVKQTGGFVFQARPGGTTFRIYRTLRAAAPISKLRPAARRRSARGLTGSGRVLLVEDEDPVRSLPSAPQAAGLRGDRGDVRSRGTGKFEEVEKVDIVVSDVDAGMDGEMLKEPRNARHQGHLHVRLPDDAFKRNLDPSEHAFLAGCSRFLTRRQG